VPLAELKIELDQGRRRVVAHAGGHHQARRLGMAGGADDGRAELGARLQPPVGKAEHLELPVGAGGGDPEQAPACGEAGQLGLRHERQVQAEQRASQHRIPALELRLARARGHQQAILGRGGGEHERLTQPDRLDEELGGERHQARLLQALGDHERAVGNEGEHAQPSVELELRHRLERRQREPGELGAPVARHHRQQAIVADEADLGGPGERYLGDLAAARDRVQGQPSVGARHPCAVEAGGELGGTGRKTHRPFVYRIYGEVKATGL
jgi:hypothetical protein